jgi:hypothetical protein
MKTIPSLALLAALAAVEFCGTWRSVAAEDEGVAVAIVYDTSGSMRDPVRDSDGKSTAKYLIANRALVSIANQIQAFATNKSPLAPRKIDAGLFVFAANSAREAIKFGPFDAEKLREWARNFSNPTGNTPLGNALSVASRAVLDSPLPRKHVLVITDGMNTTGPDPAAVLPKLKAQAERKQTSLSVHFVAFDVDAKVFDPVRKLGATVVSAADEKQLNTQLDYIMQKKILLEEEETPKKPQ